MFTLLIVVLAVITIVLSILAYKLLGTFDNSPVGGGVTLVICLILSGLICWGVYSFCYKNEHWETCHVTKTDRGTDSSGNSNYRVYTSDCDTLANEDSFFRQKWDSSNVWEQIQAGNIYRFRVVGVRVPWMSQFQNILEVQPAPAG
jgi:hypothetical protein